MIYIITDYDGALPISATTSIKVVWKYYLLFCNEFGYNSISKKDFWITFKKPIPTMKTEIIDNCATFLKEYKGFSGNDPIFLVYIYENEK